MKRVDLLRHLSRHGCVLLREGGRRSVHTNPAERRVSTVRRHGDINDLLARKICRDLAISEPEKRT